MIAALKRADFEAIRTKGSYYFMLHPDGRCTVIPVHSGEIIGPGLLNKNLNVIPPANPGRMKIPPAINPIL
ncbi:MAG: addiction module toxin, HicA family [Deltaproteobacteria bacterium]|nr:addiction module toxin, HicA family [Deltaproteobacteria bacterium]